MTESARQAIVPPIGPGKDGPQAALAFRLAPDAEQLIAIAARLGQRDVTALTHIIRRIADICEAEGEEIALAVLDQVKAILQGRVADA